MRVYILTLLLLFSLSACSNTDAREIKQKKNMEEIYFAGGCFWGTEHFMKQIRGVESTKVGYANSRKPNPTYREVCSGETDAVETVKVVYDSNVLSLQMLIDLYLKTIDPTSVNKQGNDRGRQYRTGIYYSDKDNLPIIKQAMSNLAEKIKLPIAIEVKKLVNFYIAEPNHQDYLEVNPGGYCHLAPSLFALARKANQIPQYKRSNEADLRKSLTDLQYAVTQEQKTERAFFNEYWNEEREGIYVDITTGEPLFVSSDKFNSNCGWPSFSRPIDNTLIEESIDKSHGMTRTEVKSKTGAAHLGHVFTDGPKDKGGFRYCINSASLRFIPKEDMLAKGYGAYLPLIDKNRKK